MVFKTFDRLSYALVLDITDGVKRRRPPGQPALKRRRAVGRPVHRHRRSASSVPHADGPALADVADGATITAVGRLAASPGRRGRTPPCRLLTRRGLPTALFAQVGLPATGWPLRAAACDKARDLSTTSRAAWRGLVVQAWSRTPRATIVALADPLSPSAAAPMSDPPLLRPVRAGAGGHLALASIARFTSIAIVGSRNPTPQGERHARIQGRASRRPAWWSSRYGAGRRRRGPCGALDGASQMLAGVTVAVVGTGLDLSIPRQHRALAL